MTRSLACGRPGQGGKRLSRQARRRGVACAEKKEVNGWWTGTVALVIALWRAAWIWRWFVQPAIVWCRGARSRRPLHQHSPYTARTLRCRWQARRGVVVGPQPMLGKRRPPWGRSSVVAAGPRGGEDRCRSEPHGAWKRKKRRCKGCHTDQELT